MAWVTVERQSQATQILGQTEEEKAKRWKENEAEKEDKDVTEMIVHRSFLGRQWKMIFGRAELLEESRQINSAQDN